MTISSVAKIVITPGPLKTKLAKTLQAIPVAKLKLSVPHVAEVSKSILQKTRTETATSVMMIVGQISGVSIMSAKTTGITNGYMLNVATAERCLRGTDALLTEGRSVPLNVSILGIEEKTRTLGKVAPTPTMALTGKVSAKKSWNATGISVKDVG